MAKSDLARQMFEPEQPVGAPEAAKRGVQAVLPGLSWSKFKREVGAELSHMGKLGAHELAAALFSGSAFVMYPKAGQEGPEAGVHGTAEKYDALAKDASPPSPPAQEAGQQRGIEM